MTESGHAASFGIDIIIMASAGGVELAVGAAAVERHDGVCAEAGVIPQQGALAYGSCAQIRVDSASGTRQSDDAVDHNFDDNADDSCPPNYADNTTSRPLNSLFTLPARSWQSGGQGRAAVAAAAVCW